jgi:hypothetical protein
VSAFPYAFLCETERVAEALSLYARSAHAGTSSRLSVSLERTWILHSGNNTLRDVVNLSSASESPVKMTILSTFKLLSDTGSVAFQIPRRSKHNQVDQNSRVPSENSYRLFSTSILVIRSAMSRKCLFALRWSGGVQFSIGQVLQWIEAHIQAILLSPDN